jgi:hypothetical protein
MKKSQEESWPRLARPFDLSNGAWPGSDDASATCGNDLLRSGARRYGRASTRKQCLPLTFEPNRFSQDAISWICEATYRITDRNLRNACEIEAPFG